MVCKLFSGRPEGAVTIKNQNTGHSLVNDLLVVSTDALMNNPDKNIIPGDDSVNLPDKQFAALLSEVMENFSAGIFVSDDEGKQIFCNSNLSSVLNETLQSPDTVRITSAISRSFPDAAEEIGNLFNLSDRHYEEHKSVFVSGDALLRICRKDFVYNDRNYIIWSFEKLRNIEKTEPLPSDTEALKSLNEVLLEKNIYLTELISSLNKFRTGLKSTEKINDDFLSVIAHDIKSPFQGLFGMCEVIAASDDITPEQIQHYAGSIKNSAVNIYQLIDRLLQWSWMHLSTKSFVPVKCDLKWEVLTAVNSFRDQLDDKKIIIEDDIPEEAQIFADENMLGSIIRNLLSNAVKFSFPGGAIRINCRTEEKKSILIIEDGGTGITEENINKILYKNEIFSTRGTGDEDGSGLGLILVKEMMKVHGGAIRIESTLGNGSAFYIEFPNTLEKD